MAQIKPDRIIRNIKEYTDAEIKELQEAIDSEAQRRNMGKILAKVKSRHGEILKQRFDYLGLKATSEKIELVQASQINIIIDVVAETFFQRGLEAARHFDEPVQRMRVLTAAIYAAAESENGRRTKEVVSILAGKMMANIQPLKERVEELESGALFMCLNEENYRFLGDQITTISKLAAAYAAAKDSDTNSDSAEKSKLALEQLRIEATKHEDIFAEVEIAASATNKRGRKREPELDLLGKLACKYEFAGVDRRGMKEIAQKIFGRLLQDKIEGSLVDAENALYEKLKPYFEGESTQTTKKSEGSLSDLISRELLRYKEQQAIVISTQ